MSSKPNLESVRAQFRLFTGGQITLTKNDEDGIALIAFDHTEKKNGFSGKMMVDFNEIISSLESWTLGKGVILYGKGDTFCSGGYLDTVREIANSKDGFRMASLMHDSILRLRQLPLISLSIIQGKAYESFAYKFDFLAIQKYYKRILNCFQALGGGAELMLASDFRLMCSDAYIAFVEARMGVGTGWGGGYLLTELLGRTKALDILLTCRKVNADEAHSIGLVDEVLDSSLSSDSEARLAFGRQWLSKRIRHSPMVLKTVKKIVNACNLDEESEIFARSWGGPDQLRALSQHIKHK